MAAISFESVSREFAGGALALQDFTLDIADGEFMALVGPSGSGKSTALRLLAGLDYPTTGAIRINGRDVAHIPAKDRNLAMVFQSYALFPHLDVFDNIAFGLQIRHVPKDQIRQRTEQVARSLGLAHLLHRKPAALSGGERQRVALGRAIVRQGVAMLMDEPLSNLDAQLRVQMRTELRRLHLQLQVTTIYVTHDQVEAITLGDRVTVLRRGVIEQVDSPENLYSRPANVFVASFIGTPSMNLMLGEVQREGSAYTLKAGTFRACLGAEQGNRLLGKLDGADQVIVGIRPEDLTVEGTRGVPWSSPWQVTVDVAQVLGKDVEFNFAPRGMEGQGAAVPLDPTRTNLHSDIAMRESGGGLIAKMVIKPTPRPGETLELFCPVERLHFFHPATSKSLSS